MRLWQVLVLENVRFYKEEEKNDGEFSRKVWLSVPFLSRI